MGEVNHNNRAFDDLVAEMKRDYPSEMALAGEWAAGWADGVKHGAAQIDTLRAENAELVALLEKVAHELQHIDYTNELVEPINMVLAKHRGEK